MDPKQQLYDAIIRGRAPHAVFLDCADAPLTTSTVRRAAALFCFGAPDMDRLAAFPDYYELDEPIIKIDAIRELTGALHNRPFAEGGRAVAILGAHRMNENAQNALLKSLEEPPPRTLFLLCGNRSGLLPTICSRCQTLHMAASQSELISYLSALGASPREAELYAAQGVSMQRAERLYKDAEYRDLRKSAQDAMYAALSGGTPFNTVKGLASNAQDAMEFMLDLVGELIVCRETGSSSGWSEPERIRKLCARFTSGQLNDIIALTVDAMRRFSVARQGSAALDWLFAGITKTVLEA